MDITFEAAFLRAALLLGLAHEDEVVQWAQEGLTLNTPPAGVRVFAEVQTVRPKLSALREALRHVSESVSDAVLVPALLTRLALEDRPQMSDDDMVQRWLRVLSDMRREFALPTSLAAAVKALADRQMLAEAGVGGVSRVAPAELRRWLDEVRGSSVFSFVFGETTEAAAFLAAVSRALDRQRRSAPRGAAPQVWRVRETYGAGVAVVVNESAWGVTRSAFAPLPVASRIPRSEVPDDAVEVLNDVTLAPLGMEAATVHIAG